MAMKIKTERVGISDIKLGDSIIHWDRTLTIDTIEPDGRGVIFTASDNSVDYSRFVRYPGETMVRVTLEND